MISHLAHAAGWARACTDEAVSTKANFETISLIIYLRYLSVLSYGSTLPRQGRSNLPCDTSALPLARSNGVSDRNMPGRRLEFARCIPLERHRSSSHDIQASPDDAILFQTRSYTIPIAWKYHEPPLVEKSKWNRAQHYTWNGVIQVPVLTTKDDRRELEYWDEIKFIWGI